jgi:hypothetical protein
LEFTTTLVVCGGNSKLHADETDPRSVNDVRDDCDGDGFRRSPVEPQKKNRELHQVMSISCPGMHSMTRCV